MARYARREVRPLGLVFGLVLANAGVEALKPWPMKLILDNVLAKQPLPASLGWIQGLPGSSSGYALLAWLTAATVVLFLAGSAFKMLQAYIHAGAGSRMSYRLGADLFEHIQRLSLRFHTRNRSGDLMQRIVNDSGCVRLFVSEVTMPLITSLATLAAMFGVMWKMDRMLTGVALLAAPPLLLVIKWLARPMEQRSYEQSELSGQMTAVAEQTLTAIPIIQAFGREPQEDRRFAQLAERTGRAYVRCTVAELQFKVACTSVTALGTAGMIWFGGLHAIGGRLTVGTLMVFLSYLASLYSPMEAIAYLASGYSMAAAGSRRVLEVLSERDSVSEKPQALELPAGAAPRIGFHDVSFGYLSRRTVLNNITLEIEPGETVGLVGSTGCGKSTLLSLIPRLFDPGSGSITWDGRDVRDIRLASLRSRIAVVLQDPYLFPVSVAENIAYGRPDATRQEVEAAAVEAQADEFIRGLPQGYDTVIGERGSTLSGGERQRISIARAFLKNAPLLLLDEPTASLDAGTETEIVGALERLMAGRTTIIVAHRLSTLRNANRILVLDNGTLVQAGSERQLLEQDGPYRRLHTLQYAGAAGTGGA
jgi:ATP-binding cassette subfamily B protein/subfamily B ATP-binding cassette protein MsbA